MAVESRTELREKLISTHFDVVVVGGGISGAWITHLLTQAGYHCALIERKDFASETSSSSSKLLHGGIRYLQQMDFAKVRESTLERARYLASAPHMASAVPFIVPTFKDLKRSKAFLNAGMVAYRTLGLGQGRLLAKAGVKLPATHSLDADALNALCQLPDLDHTGAVVFPEFHLYDSERTVWSLVDSARDGGATVVNHASADSLLVEGDRVAGIMVSMSAPEAEFPVKAKLVINAAGPWVDRVTGTLDEDRVSPLINGYATGAHLITRQLVADHAIAINTRQKSSTRIDRGGRHIFVIPWRGLSLIGTSYRETDDPDDADLLTQEDMDQLLDAVNEALPHAQLQQQDIISAFSGLYPLRVQTIRSNEYQGTGEYLICDHDSNNALKGLITSLGAKYTTGRKLGELTTALVKKKLPPNNTVASRPDHTDRLSCARYTNLSTFKEQQHHRYGSRFSTQQIEHWIHTFGSTMDAFIAYMDSNSDSELLHSTIISGQPDVFGQIAWAVENEMALHLEDALLRRTSVGLLGITRSQIQTAAKLMASLLGWSDSDITREILTITNRQDVIATTARNYHAQR